ncbi:744_t:CDS:1, partial [Dentiscutata erythropus]
MLCLVSQFDQRRQEIRRSCSPPPSYEETISSLSRESSFSSRRSQSTSPVRSSFCEEDNNGCSVVLW